MYVLPLKRGYPFRDLKGIRSATSRNDICCLGLAELAIYIGMPSQVMRVQRSVFGSESFAGSARLASLSASLELLFRNLCP